jgi:hypothetical protein
MTEPQHPDQLVNTPVGGDIDQELTQAKRGFGKVTIGLGIGVLVVAAFFGGIWVHSATATASSSTAAPAAGTPRGQGRFPNGYNGAPPSGAAGAPGQGGAGGLRGGTVGTIDRVEGNTVYVKMQDGTEVKVSTTDSTRVELTQPGKIADLKAGTSVVVQGQRAEDNSVSAQTITTRPAQ